MEFLNARDAAKILNISTSTIYKWSETGVIPTRRFGKKTLRFLVSDLEIFSREATKGN